MANEADNSKNLLENLPELTDKQAKFVLFFSANSFKNASDAIRQSYDCENMSKEAINVEASKMLKHPKVALWIEYAKKNVQENIQDEIRYTINDAFRELNELKDLALKSLDKYGNPKIESAIKVIENKCRLKGYYKDKMQVTGGGLQDVLDKLK